VEEDEKKKSKRKVRGRKRDLSSTLTEDDTIGNSTDDELYPIPEEN
jgi:hypothetical protein